MGLRLHPEPRGIFLLHSDPHVLDDPESLTVDPTWVDENGHDQFRNCGRRDAEICVQAVSEE
eukprot:5853410-Amphidinium_carterae.1